MWLEAGLFGRHLDTGPGKVRKQIDPRVGVGWRLTDSNWLRAAYQRELVLPSPIGGSLAPQAVMGFLTPFSLVRFGSSVESFQAQWDSEWSDHLFSRARFEQRSIDRFSAFVAPDAFAPFADNGRIRTLELSINAWFIERFGLFSKLSLQDSENTSPGVIPGRDLPLVPRRSFSAGILWIHPRQIRARVATQYVGSRFNDGSNSARLDGFWTTNVSAC